MDFISWSWYNFLYENSVNQSMNYQSYVRSRGSNTVVYLLAKTARSTTLDTLLFRFIQIYMYVRIECHEVKLNEKVWPEWSRNEEEEEYGGDEREYENSLDSKRASESVFSQFSSSIHSARANTLKEHRKGLNGWTFNPEEARVFILILFMSEMTRKVINDSQYFKNQQRRNT